ncbi:adenosylmethionine decarboxylase [Agarivorans sp.]|uniref:adenosylmethionine decarboxylase n=1 Tax=Agarivorans sp. TaxID=1872412 RepID=UPI003D043085
MTHLFFEGSEKKLELSLVPGSPSLRSLGYEFWSQAVHIAKAEILSQISNEYCDAYLLSESSLFVWDQRCLMLTCGNTTLVDAAIWLDQQLGSENIAFLSYQRKNEYQLQLQPSCPKTDLSRLREAMPMKAYQLGYLDSHHHFVCHLDKAFTPPPRDITCELLMYHVQGPNADYLRSEGQSIEQVRKLLKLDLLFPGFTIDDYLFEPHGYSMNALRGEHYATIHVTPEQHSSYVSLETNLNLGSTHAYIVKQLLSVLQPSSWDTLGFNCQPFSPLGAEQIEVSKGNVDLSCGYQVDFRHYQHLQRRVQPVIQL